MPGTSTDNGDPAAQRPKRLKRPRVIAPPAHLSTVVTLTGRYQPVTHSVSVDRALAQAKPAGTSVAAGAAPRASDPLAEFRAKDDDPRLWGDAPEDLAELMKREKPPHW